MSSRAATKADTTGGRPGSYRSKASDGGNSIRSTDGYAYPTDNGRESGIDTSFASASRLNAQRGTSYLTPRDASFGTDARIPASEAYEGQDRLKEAPPLPVAKPEFTSVNRTRPVSSHGQQTAAEPPRSAAPRTSDPYARREESRPLPASARSTDRHLSTWSRSALEARVETLEKMLAEKEAPGNRQLSIKTDDRDLSEHLQVTVRKNRELRAELEVTKNRLATLLEEREAFALKLGRDNDSLQSLLEEAQRAKEALGSLIKTLSAEKNDLAHKLALAEDEIRRLQTSGSAPIIQFDELRGNIEDVAVINEGLRESLRQMQLKNPAFAGVPEEPAQ